ncbi:MAG TPA: sigma-70 family RNA polymerase sigma factor [Bacteroidia bacterium]|jgi:RNA polymerase sigma-70 factor (ECF subfamily)|nr:sigma-70 family RNA polymerase sigma factor [Bacteroidia bacterium]
MSEPDLITACLKNDKIAKKQFYETYYTQLAVIALRYSKNKEQSTEMIQKGFAFLFSNLHKFKPSGKLIIQQWLEEEFIVFCVEFIRNIRSEYYVASTVRVTDSPAKTYDLFVDSTLTDFKSVDFDVLIKSLQQLVPSQRLIFNLHVVEGYDMRKAAEILEASEQTVKANLEKAKYNLQKNIDKNNKLLKNEQFV